MRGLVKRCGRCGIRFLTGAGNLARADIGCGFGCREERKREKVNERGRRHYRTPHGKTKKSALNRARSELTVFRPRDKCPTALKKPPALFIQSVVQYIAYVASLTSKRRPPLHEVEKFLNEVLVVVTDRRSRTILRQRSLPERGG